MTEAPANTIDSALRCPRCCYNLTGLLEQRCPECGQAFDAAQLADGLARENIPTRLDRCDPWQPHQVLIASLSELAHNAVRPTRVLKRISLDGPWWSSLLMLLSGLFWNYAILTLGISVAIFASAGVSPAAAFRAAALWWCPGFVGAAFVVSAWCALGLINTEWVLPSAPHLVRRRFRIAAYWTPVCMLWSTFPTLIMLVLAPEFGVEMLAGAMLVSVLLSITVAASIASRPPGIGSVVSVLVFHALAALQIWIQSYGRGVMPKTLAPPLWVYFVSG